MKVSPENVSSGEKEAMGSSGQVGWKQISIVFVVLLVVLFVGAGIFKVLEEHFYNPEAQPARITDLEDVIAEFVWNHTNVTHHEVYNFIRHVDTARHGYSTIDNEMRENKSIPHHLDYMESWYFCMTLVTTIGYGHMGPVTDAGKVFCIIYAFLGIPIWIILLTLVGAQLGDSSRWIEKRVRELIVKITKVPRKFRAPGLAVSLTIMLSLFFFIPALIFMHVEDWTYLEAMYFSVITLTTVGFGDYVAALPSETMHIAANVVYKLAVFMWITVGLAFLAGSLERIGHALKLLAEKATDMDLDPTEINDQCDDEDDSTNQDKDPKMARNEDHSTEDEFEFKTRKDMYKDSKETKPQELSEWGKGGKYRQESNLLQ